ncbi:hypothetical protein Bca52824_035558 [Brassica carinata]|uniref:Uncharacterized protein n=1 Tax=Brassica carinata TaxID=52824 RepID=A0A8X7V2V1_BRACI|nr:hypothetical protein Bca52824_035558 [Brassica carinata]
MRLRKYLQISEEKLMRICSSARMEEIIMNAESVVRNEIDQPVIEENGIQSETDSFDEMDVLTQGGEEIIRLSQMTNASSEQDNLTLAIGDERFGTAEGGWAFCDGDDYQMLDMVI